MPVLFQILVHALPQLAGSLAVNDPHLFKMRDRRVVEILIQFGTCFVHGFPEEIDLGTDRHGLGHADSAG